MKKILLSTGGSGGHVIPALNLYDHLKTEFDVKIYTDRRGSKYIPTEINKTVFEVKKFPEKKYFFPIKIIFLFFDLIKSIFHLSTRKFDILISTGGYMSLPLVLASKLFNIKIFLFEPNSIIGRSNKFLLNFSNKIFCYDKNLKGLKKKYNHKILEIPPILNRCFYFKKNIVESNNVSFKVLIIGGSQASLFFSKYLKKEILKLSYKHKIEITQQVSNNFNLESYKKDYEINNIKNNLFFFEQNLLCKNQNFDIAISRAGASSLAELSNLNIPFIAIPYPYSTDNHQYLNAKRYYDLNCCWILEEKNFNSGDIYKIIDQLITNKNEYYKKKEILKKMNDKRTWENITGILKNYLNEN